MGDIEKAKAKAKDKLKTKMKKIARKAKKATQVAGVIAVLAMLSGCATTGEQPARSQTQNNEFRDCVIIVRAEAGEICTQTQANEGSETISQDATPTNTTETKARLQASPPRKGGILGAVEALATPVQTSGGCEGGMCEGGACEDE